MVRRSHGTCARCHARPIHIRSRWGLCERCRVVFIAERKQTWRDIKQRRKRKQSGSSG